MHVGDRHVGKMNLGIEGHNRQGAPPQRRTSISQVRQNAKTIADICLQHRQRSEGCAAEIDDRRKHRYKHC